MEMIKSKKDCTLLSPFLYNQIVTKKRGTIWAATRFLSNRYEKSYHPNTFMIIHSDIQIKDYPKTVLNIESGFRGGEASRGMFRCPNPDCRCDRFYRHGTYHRYFISLSEGFQQEYIPTDDGTLTCFDGMQTHLLTILRLKCTGCGQTHAVLPGDVVPFHVLSLLLQLMILAQLYKTEHTELCQKRELHQTEKLSWPVLYALLQTYQSYHAKMMHTLRVKSIYSHPSVPSDYILLSLFISQETQALFFFRKVFFSQLFLTRQSTVSYPVRLIIH